MHLEFHKELLMKYCIMTVIYLWTPVKIIEDSSLCIECSNNESMYKILK
jgi:hypothetical protein